MLMLTAMVFTVSCSDDEETEQLSELIVQLAADEQVDDFTKFAVSVTDLKSGGTTTANADATGKAVFRLALGAYNITATDGAEGANTMYGHTENFMLSAASATATVKLTPTTVENEQSFVLDELYFNGDKNGEWDYVYYESYLTITNVGSKPMYADGLSIAICGDYNSIEADNTDPMPQYLMRDSIVVTQLYTIPGDGTKYKVEPGKSLVLAHTAINHKLDYEGNPDPEKKNSIDLSGADFEFYVPYEYSMTTDNPEVTNMIVDYSMNQAFNWGYSGATPIMLVKLDAAQKKDIINRRVMLDIPAGYGQMALEHLVLPLSCVIDGVETGTRDNMFRKVLPDAVDRGSILIAGDGLYGGFDGQFIKRRRTTDASGVTTIVDTNNSTSDFEIIEHGQKSYPAK